MGDDGLTGLTRRHLLAALAAGTCTVPAFGQRAQNPPAPARPTEAPPFAPSRTIALRASAVDVKLGEAREAASQLFRLLDTFAPGADPLPLPVIRTRVGQDIALAIENRLTQPIAFHARGARQPNAFDGVPGLTGQVIAPGSTATLPFSARQAGTFLLTPVMREHVSEQVARGLKAVLIVEEAEPPSVDHDLAFAVGDYRLDDASILMDGFNAKADAARIGRLGNRLTANGAPAPGRMVVRPGARIRLRLVNVANARMIPLRVANLVARVVAIDSTPCAPFDPLKKTVVVTPGSRIDLLIDCPREAGLEGVIEARIGNGMPIYAFRTEGAPLPSRSEEIRTLPDPGLPPAIRLQEAIRADVAISGGVPRDLAVEDKAGLERLVPDGRAIYRINGQPGGFGAKPLIRVPRGRVVVLALRNQTAWPQALALHGHSFRLLHPFDDGWEPYFLDTLYLAPNSLARIAFIADNPGRWALRSTIAEHFASGVATWIDVG